MFLLAILIACGGGEQAGSTSSEPAVPAKRLNVAKVTASSAGGPRKMPLEVLLTGDPSMFGTYVDAGEVWIDIGLGSMIIDEFGKVVTKPDITKNIRSIGLRGVDPAHVIEEKVDVNSEGNTLKRVRAVGKYQGCEASPDGTGATICYIDVGDPPPGYRAEIEAQPRFSPGFTTVPGSHASPAPAPTVAPAPVTP